MKMKKFTPFFIPDSHKRICESGLSGPVLAWRGRRHGSKISLQATSSKNVSDADELLALLTGGRNYMINAPSAGNPRAANCHVGGKRRRIARRSRAPQMSISIMPLTDQEKTIKY
jgi:hypothetical protein